MRVLAMIYIPHTIFYNCRILSKGALSCNIALTLTMKQPHRGPSLIGYVCVRNMYDISNSELEVMHAEQ